MDRSPKGGTVIALKGFFIKKRYAACFARLCGSLNHFCPSEVLGTSLAEWNLQTDPLIEAIFLNGGHVSTKWGGKSISPRCWAS